MICESHFFPYLCVLCVCVCIITPDAKIFLNFKMDIWLIIIVSLLSLTIYTHLNCYIMLASLKISQNWGRILLIFEN